MRIVANNLRTCYCASIANAERCRASNPSYIKLQSRHRSTQTSPDTAQARSQFQTKSRHLFAFGLLGLTLYAAKFYFQDGAQPRDALIPYTLIEKQPVSSTASIFTLAAPANIDEEQKRRFQEAFARGIWNVHVKQPQIQIVRAYTPLPPPSGTTQAGDDTLRFLIRRDPAGGEVSNYLHKLPLGARVEIRGPNVEYEVSEVLREVLFLAGGTGIAPALQVARAMFGTQGSAVGGREKRLHILWANKRREDCEGGISGMESARGNQTARSSLWGFFGFAEATPAKSQESGSGKHGAVVHELEALKGEYPGQVKVDYFVDEEATFINRDVVTKALDKILTTDLSSSSLAGSKQVIVSGPDGFISYIAGPKIWSEGREQQGKVAGVLGEIERGADVRMKVWKV